MGTDKILEISIDSHPFSKWKNTHFDINGKRTKLLAAGLIYLLIIGWGLLTYFNGWKGLDWAHYFQPWTLAFLSGRTPYISPSNLYPPWTFMLLAPLAILPLDVARIVVSFLCMGSFGYVAWRMGAKPLPLALLVFSPQIAFLAMIGNIDLLVILGYILPAPVGLFFVLIKPQIGFAVAVFWLVEAFRNGGIKQIARTFGPVTLAHIVSILIYGPFFLPHGSGFMGASWGCEHLANYHPSGPGADGPGDQTVRHSQGNFSHPVHGPLYWVLQLAGRSTGPAARICRDDCCSGRDVDYPDFQWIGHINAHPIVVLGKLVLSPGIQVN